MEFIQSVMSEWNAPTVTIFLIGTIVLAKILSIEEKLGQIIENSSSDGGTKKFDKSQENVPRQRRS